LILLVISRISVETTSGFVVARNIWNSD
jgi:hypothetical protein